VHVVNLLSQIAVFRVMYSYHYCTYEIREDLFKGMKQLSIGVCVQINPLKPIGKHLYHLL
jgi:hypothetical protein